MPVLRTRNATTQPATAPSIANTTPPVPHSSANAPPHASTGFTALPVATQKKAVAQPMVHPLKKYAANKKIQEMKVFCYNCKGEVIGSNVLGHLFFGKLKCAYCCHTLVYCSDFQELYPSKEDCPVKGKHSLVEWEQPVWDFLYYSTCRELTISTFCSNKTSADLGNEILDSIHSYLERLTPLKDMKPWDVVLSDPLIEEKLRSRKPLRQTQTFQNRNQSQPSFPTNNQKLNSRSQSGCERLPTSMPPGNTNVKDAQGTPSGSANHDGRGKSTTVIEAAVGTGGNSKEASRLVSPATQESKHQKTAQMQQDIINKANQRNTESSKSTHTANRSKAETNRKQDINYSSLPSASPTKIQLDMKNKASLQNIESLKSSTCTVHITKAVGEVKQSVAHPSTALDSPVKKLIPEVTHFLRSSRSSQELKQPQNTAEVLGQDSTQSINSPFRTEIKVRVVGMKAKEDTAEDADKNSTLFSRETRQKSQSLIQQHSDLVRGKRKRSPRRNKWYSDLIPSKVLSSGYYLVVVFPKQDCPDECPTCYCPFDPKMITVNLSTCVGNLVCPECRLSIYMVPTLAYDKSVKNQSEELKRVM